MRRGKLPLRCPCPWRSSRDRCKAGAAGERTIVGATCSTVELATWRVFIISFINSQRTRMAAEKAHLKEREELLDVRESDLKNQQLRLK